MPTTKSAKKRLRQNERIRARNRAVKSVLKVQVRKVREAVTAKNIPEAEKEFRITAKKLDQAVSKHVIHRNKASRTKSRLQSFIKIGKQPVDQTAGPEKTAGPRQRQTRQTGAK